MSGDTNNLITVKAKIRLHSRGGRKAGIVSGYRPEHVFEYLHGDTIKANFMGQIDFEYDEIKRGEDKIVTVKFINTETVREYLTVGRTWWLYEGARQVGEGKIIEIVE